MVRTKIKTVKDLKDFIKDLPDDTKILSYCQGMEKSGYFHPNCSLDNFTEETHHTYHTYDAFDYEKYDYTTFMPQKDGEECLTINSNEM